MRVIKRILILCAAFVFCFAISITTLAATANRKRETVTLTYPMVDKSTSQYSGRAGKGTGSNSTDSTVPMNFYLKKSSGTFWAPVQSKLVAKGGTWNSGQVDSSSDVLFRVDLVRQVPAYPTSVYWKATGNLYTD